MSRGKWRPQPGRVDPRATWAGRQLVAAVRARVARTGERCWFYGRKGYETCPGRIDLTLPTNHRWAFTTHHVNRLMDGGQALPDPRTVPAAHRSCNSADGLRAQNTRRRLQRTPGATSSPRRTPQPPPSQRRPERTSEPW